MCHCITYELLEGQGLLSARGGEGSVQPQTFSAAQRPWPAFRRSQPPAEAGGLARRGLVAQLCLRTSMYLLIVTVSARVATPLRRSSVAGCGLEGGSDEATFYLLVALNKAPSALQAQAVGHLHLCLGTS